MGRYVFDETLSDLAGITATCNIPSIQATRDKPCMVTVTIEASVLQQILTAASLYRYDHDESNGTQEDHDWATLQKDTIAVLKGRIAKAQGSDTDNDKTVALDRRCRRLLAEAKAKQNG